MEDFAHFIMDEIGYKIPPGTQLQDISAFSYRYSMYKVSKLFHLNLNFCGEITLFSLTGRARFINFGMYYIFILK